MTRASVSFLVIPLVLAPLLDGRAHAEDVVAPAPEAEITSSRATTRFLPNTSSAMVGTSLDVSSAWGGYDGAARTPIFNVGTEVRIVRRVALTAGVAYGNASAADAGLRPQLGARVQLFQQAASGVDASLAVMFRQDRFTAEDGLFQGALAVGRSFGETSAVMNVVYAQDGEGDDHEGEVRLAGVRHVRGGLHLGVEGRYMHSIDSTDPHRQALGTPSMEAMAGPLVAYVAGTWTLLAEAGFAARETLHLETGVTALGGVGTTF
jgi:hypothetical protein